HLGICSSVSNAKIAIVHLITQTVEPNLTESCGLRPYWPIESHHDSDKFMLQQRKSDDALTIVGTQQHRVHYNRLIISLIQTETAQQQRWIFFRQNA
ncbi:MAG TPA: hypothetical protein VF682_16065, partial [Pseudomonas sp.]